MTYIPPAQESSPDSCFVSGSHPGKGVFLACSQCTVGVEFHAGFKHIHCIQTQTLLTNPFPWFQGWWASLFTKKEQFLQVFAFTQRVILQGYKRIKVAEHPQRSAISSAALCSFHANLSRYNRARKNRPKCLLFWNKLKNATDARIPPWFWKRI